MMHSLNMKLLTSTILIVFAACQTSIRRDTNLNQTNFIDLAYEAKNTNNVDSMINTLQRMAEEKQSILVIRALAICYRRQSKLLMADTLYRMMIQSDMNNHNRYRVLQEYSILWLEKENIDSSVKYINMAYNLSQNLPKDWFHRYQYLQSLWFVYMFKKDCTSAISMLDSIDMINEAHTTVREVNFNNRVETMNKCKEWNTITKDTLP